MTITGAPGDTRILVVEDSPANIQILASVLKQDGYQVSIATNGRQALEVVAKVRPSLILMDVMMPEMDGFEACRQLKENGELAEIPVIFLTARAEAEDIVRGFELGAVDYVAKPFNTHEVLARVHTHLELRRQRKELEENYRQLRDLERLRDSLVHMVVHDLRSPLLGLSGCLQLLQADLEGKLEAEQQEDLDSALSAALRLGEMVSSLLDVSRLESGQMPLKMERLDLGNLLGSAIESLGGLTHHRQVFIHPAQEGVTVDCDREVVIRIIANLVANALKFTPSNGEVRLAARLVDGKARVEVSDSGPGIPPEYRTRIFEKFGQVEGREEGRKHSTGLGLTFCKLAVEAHGGSISVDSEPGSGSTFWFCLPVAHE